MITIDITLLFQIINIFILMFVLNLVLYKPVLGILRAREEKMAGTRQEVAKFEKNAQQRQEEVDKKMAEASAKAKSALDTARGEAASAGNERLAAIKAEADAMKEKKMAEITAETEAAATELRAGLEGFATEMAGKILGRSI